MAADIVPLRPTGPLALVRALAVVTWGGLVSAIVMLVVLILVGIVDEEGLIPFPSTVDAALRAPPRACCCSGSAAHSSRCRAGWSTRR
ncbi:hypothetical protein [Microbacterium karelineae]|uniref:hypothetical protein n=1 Tax=Microbacterium karelineae TaxID=2654283 RepID=UPI0012E9F022|nr:hypothetical protein [Microbacterium karelineae]